MTHFVGALDQGTTSTRFAIFDPAGQLVAIDQREHSQILPQAGWVEHDPLEILDRTRAVIAGALGQANFEPADLVAIGVTNQRETTVVWDRHTGRPIHNAIVWQDTRTDQLVGELGRHTGQDRFRAATGLPLATYFSGPKLRWILDHVPAAQSRAEAGDLLFGTIDTWLIWNLTGGPARGIHVTDVTNASRTQLMSLASLEWDAQILAALDIPAAMLPRIRSSSEVYGQIADGQVPGVAGGLAGVPIAADLGDQHAALFGQTCFGPGEAKNTYGTGCFLLLNTGPVAVPSTKGLLTTLAYRLGDQPPVYALEGSIAIAGALVGWLRDNLGLITDSDEIESLARTVPDNGGVYIVPAFSGLFAPYWRSEARGVIVGLTRFVNRGHIARAALEATAWQTREVVDAMRADSGATLAALKVDGGMVGNDLLMQFQADVLGIPVIRPKVAETTALGAAYAAGLAVGLWPDLDALRANWHEDRTWTPTLDAAARERAFGWWTKAVSRTFDWLEPA
jgi:glycerol kinase